MRGRPWRNIEKSLAQKIKKYLLEQGGIEEKVTSVHEEWRIKFSDSTFTYYKNGTFYSTPSISLDSAVDRSNFSFTHRTHNKISSYISNFRRNTRRILSY